MYLCFPLVVGVPLCWHRGSACECLQYCIGHCGAASPFILSLQPPVASGSAIKQLTALFVAASRWAQDLAGVDVVSSLPTTYSGVDRQQLLSALSAYRSQLRLEALVERITAAVQGRRAMK